jgi:hypothetical protein
MENEAPDRRKQGYSLRRAISDYGMGIFIAAFGVFLIIAPKLNVNMNVDEVQRYMFAGIFLLYGGFRIYRGSKRNYFN